MTQEKRYFTVAQANSMLPMLEATFGRLMQLNAQLKQVHGDLAAEGQAPTEADFDFAPPGADHQTIDNLATFKALLDATREQIETLEREGCLVKHIENGLIDWFYRKDGRDVLLCWKLGEKSVQYWHELDAGFAGRQTVDQL